MKLVTNSTGNLWQFPIEDGLVLARPDMSGLFGLNPAARSLWSYFVAGQTPESAVDFLATEFGVDSAEAEAGVVNAFASFSAFLSQPPSVNLPLLAERAGSAYFSATYLINTTRFRLNLASETLVREVAPRLEALLVESIAPDHTFTILEHDDGFSIYRDGLLFAKEIFVTGARAVLLQELARLAEPGRDFTAILHAGAVGNSEACIILAGASFSGKSTLCAGLMQTGFLCYSDDSACLTPEFHVAGMPFALALREGQRFRPSNLNRTSITVPPAALVFVNYQSGAAASFHSLSAFEAFVELQKSGFWVEHTEPSIASFLRWLRQLPRYLMTYSSLDESVSIVRGLL